MQRREPVAAPACKLGLGGDAISLTPDVPDPLNTAVGAVGEEVLAAYQVQIDRSQRIRGHTLNLRTGVLSPEIDLSAPTSGFATVPAVVAANDKLFVAWNRQLSLAGIADPRPDVEEGRWISADGSLGPIIAFPITALGVHFARIHDGLSALYAEGRDEGDRHVGFTLYRATFDDAGVPKSSPVPLFDAKSIDEASADELSFDNGETWVVAAATGNRARTDQIHFLQLGSHGEVASAVTELSSAIGWATRPRMLRVGDEVLVAWLEESEVVKGPASVWTLILDRRGQPRGAPRRVGTTTTRWEGLDLVLRDGRPELVTGGTVRPLDENGVPVLDGTVVAPSFKNPVRWLATARGPYVAWVDRRHVRNELYLAPLACGGPAYEGLALGPVVDRRGSAPPPDAAKPSCKMSHEQTFDVASRVGGSPGIVAREQELWVTWIAGNESGSTDLWMRAINLSTHRPTGEARVLAQVATRGSFVATPEKVLLAAGAEGLEVQALIDGKPAVQPTRWSEPPVPASDPSLAISSDTVGSAWIAGNPRRTDPWAIQFRAAKAATLDSPGEVRTLSADEEQTAAPALFPAPGGFIVTWYEVPKKLIVKRLGMDGTIRWRTSIENAESNLAASVQGNQILIAVKSWGMSPTVRLVRFDLDGTLLDDSALSQGTFVAAAFESGGPLALLKFEKRKERAVLCVRRYALTGEEIGAPACSAQRPGGFWSDPGTAVIGALGWSGHTLWSATSELENGGPHLHADRFECH